MQRSDAHAKKEEGIKSLNFTAYGLRDYHDRFAGRKGDFDLLLRMMNASCEAGIPFTTGVPITKENIQTIDELVTILKEAGNRKISLFVPHEEGQEKISATGSIGTAGSFHTFT